MSMKNRMRGSLVLLCLAACSGNGSAPEPVESTPYGRPVRALWSAEADPAAHDPVRFAEEALPPTIRRTPIHVPGRLPIALSWGGFLYAHDGDLVCSDDLSGEILWRVPLVSSKLQAGGCRDTIVLLEDRRMRLLSKEGKEIASREGAPDGAVLYTTPTRAYVLTPELVAAYHPGTLSQAWQWRATEGLRFLNLVAGDDRVAVEYFSESVNHHETALLRFENGAVRHRFLGRALGWHQDRFFVLRDWTREVWMWSDVNGEYLDSRRLDSFDGRAMDVLDGKVLYSGLNRYFTEPAFRVTKEGGGPAPEEIRTVREVQLESLWRHPLNGEGRLAGNYFLDLTRDTVLVRWAWDGELLFDLRAAAGIQGVAVGPRAMAIVTWDGRIGAYRLR